MSDITTIEIVESRQLRTGANVGSTRKYKSWGTVTGAEVLEDEILTDVASESPSSVTVDGITCYRQSRKIEQVANDIYDVSVEYAPPSASNPEVGQDPLTAYSFETGGEIVHITQARGHVAKFPATAPAFAGAIGVTKDSIEGVDIIVPHYNWSETHYLADSTTVDAAYKAVVAALTGKTNTKIFRGFAIGEVLFLGASGSKASADVWAITYNFAASKAMPATTVAGIPNVVKGGWEYMWVSYITTNDATAKKPIVTATGVHIERVYDAGDFDTLEI